MDAPNLGARWGKLKRGDTWEKRWETRANIKDRWISYQAASPIEQHEFHYKVQIAVCLSVYLFYLAMLCYSLSEWTLEGQKKWEEEKKNTSGLYISGELGGIWGICVCFCALQQYQGLLVWIKVWSTTRLQADCPLYIHERSILHCCMYLCNFLYACQGF